MKDKNQPKRGRPPVPEHRKRVKPNISLAPELIEAAKRKAEELSMGFSEFVTLAMERQLARDSGKPLTPLPAIASSKIVTLPERSAHIMAAAGSPLGAEVQEWDGKDNTVRVKIDGLSMSPLFNDGDVISMHHKRGARSQFMKKGLVYLVEIGGNYAVKEYGTRIATPEEIEGGFSYISKADGKTKVHVLKSRNQDFPEIVIKDQAEWIAWFDPKKD